VLVPLMTESVSSSAVLDPYALEEDECGCKFLRESGLPIRNDSTDELLCLLRIGRSPSSSVSLSATTIELALARKLLGGAGPLTVLRLAAALLDDLLDTMLRGGDGARTTGISLYSGRECCGSV